MPYDYIEEYQKQNDETIWLFRDKDAQEKIDTSSTETAYANPLSLETMQAQLAENTKIKIEPIQDLHGYDKPWVGGAGKNLLQMTVEGIKAANIYGTWSGNTYVESAVTFTILTDSDNNVIGIKANGTSSKQITFQILTNGYAQNIYKGMIINGCTEGASNTFSVLTTYSQDGTSWATENSQVDAEQRISSNYDYMRVSILIRAGIQVSNKIFYPMIRLSTESDATFEPYSNICPISGHDEIDILGYGPNIWDEDDVEYNKVATITGDIYSSSVSNYLKYTVVMPNKTYKFSWNYDMLYSESTRAICFYDSNKNFISNVAIEYSPASKSKIITTPNNAYYIQVGVDKGMTNIFIGSENTNLSIDLPSTVYGGVLDLESGELVVDRKYMTCNGIEDWVVSDSGRRIRCDNMLPDAQIITDGNIVSDLVCNMYPTVSNNDTYTLNYGISLENKRVFISDGSGSMDATAFKSLLSSNNLQIAYPLSTPFTLYISPERLKLLKSQNNLTTSQYTQIKVTYRNGVFATLEELSDTANGIYDEISGDATTVSGNPINFTTREKQKSRSTIIDLEPIQDLHGFTKPWVGGAGKNLIDVTKMHVGNFNGVTGSINGETYNINGTVASGATGYYLGTPTKYQTFKAGTYTLTMYPNGNFGSSTELRLRKASDESRIASVYTTSTLYTTFTLSEDTNVFLAVVNSGATSGTSVNASFTVQIEQGSTSTSWSPYTNICPISGRSSVDIDGCGKNLLYCPYYDSTITRNNITFTVNNDGSILVDGTASADTTFKLNDTATAKVVYKGLTGSRIIGSGCPIGGSSTTYYLNFQGFEVSGNGINDTGSGTRVINVSDISNFSIVQIYIVIRSGVKMDNLTFRPMIRSASNTNGEFEPYTPSTDLTISFGTTVYGGRLDVEKGELVVDRGYKTLSSIASGSWNKSSYSGIPSGRVVYWTILDDCKYTGNNLNINNVYAVYNNYEAGTSSYESIATKSIFGIGLGASSNKSTIGVNVDSSIASASAFVTWLTTNEIEVVYPLATPQTLQLTPQQVQLLKGINNISTTGTTITVTFKNGSVAHLDDLPENVFTDLDKEKLASIDTLINALGLSVVDGKLCQTYNT